MKLVVQRVNYASVIVDDKIVGKINQGLLVYLGISSEANLLDIPKYVNKLINLRIFSDEFDKLNLSVKDINGEILLISQFTLWADVKRGNRPSFTKAMNPKDSNPFYEAFVSELKKHLDVETGIFGANMQINSQNAGPVTIIVSDL